MRSIDEIIEFLRESPLESEVGVYIEDYCDLQAFRDVDVPVFERFLGAANVGNREAALTALVYYGTRDGYEADAVLLYEQTRLQNPGSSPDWTAATQLGHMRDRGSRVAARILSVLEASDPYYKDMIS